VAISNRQPKSSSGCRSVSGRQRQRLKTCSAPSRALKQETEELNALAKKQNELAENRLTVAQRVKAARLEDDAESATGFERERLKLLIREKNTLDEIANLRQEASPASGSSLDRQLTELEELARSGTARAMQEAWAKARQEQKRAFEAQERERLAAEQKLQKERDEAFRNQQSILDLDAEIAAARLRLMGEDEAAEIESINRRYDARIAAAERANEAEKVPGSRRLRSLPCEKRASGAIADRVRGRAIWLG
jgi:hypothetical protein